MSIARRALEGTLDALEKSGMLHNPGNYTPGERVIPIALGGMPPSFFIDRVIKTDGSVHEEWFRDQQCTQPLGVEVIASRNGFENGSAEISVEMFTMAGELTMNTAIFGDGRVEISINSTLGEISSSATLKTENVGVSQPVWTYEFDLPEGIETGSLMLDDEDEVDDDDDA